MIEAAHGGRFPGRKQHGWGRPWAQRGTNRSSLLSVPASYIHVFWKLDMAWGQISDVILVSVSPTLPSARCSILPRGSGTIQYPLMNALAA